MAWWYRQRVEDVAAQFGCAVEPPLSCEEGALLTVHRREMFREGRTVTHVLVAFCDLGLDLPVWLPVLTPDRAPCFRFEPYGGASHGPLWGAWTMSTWLHNRRENLIARDLLLLRPPLPPEAKRQTPPWIAARKAAEALAAKKAKAPRKQRRQGSLL